MERFTIKLPGKKKIHQIIMIRKSSLIILLFISVVQFVSAQLNPFDIHATSGSPLFTTYAAPINRSDYKTDQGYEMVWYDQNRGIAFESKDGGNICLAFHMDNEFRDKLKQYCVAPVVTASCSDIVKFFYYPIKDIRVDIIFDVYSSNWAIMEICLKNESPGNKELDLYPFFQYNNKVLENISYNPGSSSFTCHISKKHDSWMEEHQIPVIEDLQSTFRITSKPESWGTYQKLLTKENIDSLNLSESINGKNVHVLTFRKTVSLKKNETYSFRIIRGLDDVNKNVTAIEKEYRSVENIDLNDIILEDVSEYGKLCLPVEMSEETGMLYLSSFNLIRQCMMPPEGKCSYNYYVFSREPKWGWGYGGQVFHESLSMLAYMYFDPVGAMNSQRVFMERQHDNGYINYRTGPYLDETIETGGQLTSSAPFFSYENLEIYKRTKDKQFLEEAYESGKKLYMFFINNRDSDHDGLCEWGGDAALESVRDARVAVWDKAGDPKKFEALDLNCILVNEARALWVMSREMGNSGDFQFFGDEVQRLITLINKTFWDGTTGFYYNVDMTDNDFSFKRTDDLKIKEIIGFLPLWAGVAGKEQARRLMGHLKNKDEFWRKYGIPTLSADNEYYNPMGYWNGPVWVQWNYLIFRGMLDYGYYSEAQQLVKNIMGNMIYQLQTGHNFWEFYSPDDHQAGWNKTYIWAGIIAKMIIDVGTMGKIH
jgi:hypothetical protein